MKKIFIAIISLIFCIELFAQKIYVRKDSYTDLMGCVDEYGQIIVPYEYEYLNVLQSNYIFSVKNSKCGLLDSTGKVCVSNSYGYGVGVDEENRTLFVKNNDGHWGLIDYNENILLPFVYDDDGYYYEGRDGIFLVKKGNKCGLINAKEKKEIVPCIYEDIRLGVTLFDNGITTVKNTFPSHLIAFKHNGKWGFFNDEGSIIIKPQYDDFKQIKGMPSLLSRYAYIFIGGRATFVRKGKVGLINEKGNEITPPIYDYIMYSRYVDEDLDSIKYMIAHIEGKGSCLLDTNGKECTKFYEDIFYDGGIVGYKKNNYFGLLDVLNGEETTLNIYDDLYNAGEGLVIFKEKDEYGYIDPKGKEVYHETFEDASCFSNGYARVKKNGKYGYVQRHGSYFTTIDCIYDEADSFNKHGIAIVKKDSKYGGINVKNKAVIPFNYDDMYKYNDSLFIVKKDDKYGLINYKGEEILPCIIENTDGDEIEYQYDQYIKKNLLAEQLSESPKFALSSEVSDVDKNIPHVAKPNKNTFVVIVANQNYMEKDISSVDFAHNDGDIFKEYCNKTLGIPVENIHYLKDGTKNQILKEVRWLKNITSVYGKEATTILFYYTGHGIPDEKTKNACILPVDAFTYDIESAYSLTNMYKQFEETNSEQIIILLDACFSGTKKEGGMLLASKGVAIEINKNIPKGNTIVFSASQGDETAYIYKDGKHGLFTYFLLKKLQETKGDVTLGDLKDFVEDNVRKYSIIHNGKLQTPTVIPSATLSQSWRKMKLVK